MSAAINESAVINIIKYIVLCKSLNKKNIRFYIFEEDYVKKRLNVIKRAALKYYIKADKIIILSFL
jgi:hypothetical protein